MTSQSCTCKLSELRLERMQILFMTVSDVCDKYNVDERSEALLLIEEEIAYFENELSDSVETEEIRESEFWESVRYMNNNPKALMMNI